MGEQSHVTHSHSRARHAVPRRAAAPAHMCEHRASCDGARARARAPRRRRDERVPDDPLKAAPQAAHPARPPAQHPPRARRVPLPVLRPSLLPLPARHPLPKL